MVLPKPKLSRPNIPLARRPQPDVDRLAPSWRDAVPDRIEHAWKVAADRDPGGWFVVAASAAVGRERSIVATVADREIALWRDTDGSVVAGPGACPHMGALLDGCAVVRGAALCRWHGLALGGAGSDWPTVPAVDDGALVWVRLPADGERPSDAPVIAPRPPAARSVGAVIELTGICEPRDVVANRLDPWHGSWFHPYAFSHLQVDDDASTAEVLVVDVTFRLGRTFGVPVRAEFTCPDARTIVMHIVEGEGRGSVVETHATPAATLPDGRPTTRVTELTIAHSARPGFAVARAAHRLVAPAIRHTQRRLWVDDLAYAERRYELRRRSEG